MIWDTWLRAGEPWKFGSCRRRGGKSYRVITVLQPATARDTLVNRGTREFETGTEVQQPGD